MGYSLSKFSCWAKVLITSGPNCAYTLLRSWPCVVWFDSTWAPMWLDLTQYGQFNQHPSEVHWKQGQKNNFYFIKRAIQGIQFVKGDHRVVFFFWALGGNSPTSDGQFCLLIPNVTWLSYLRDILGTNLPVGPMLWWYQDTIFLICCWGHDPLINLAQHGHQCGLIWLSIVNCLLPLRNWKDSQENTFSFSEWPRKITLGMGGGGGGGWGWGWGCGWGWGGGGWWWWVVVVVGGGGGRPSFFFNFGGRGEHLPNRDGHFFP